MALSFLYLAFVRSLQLFKLLRAENSDLAIEVVMLRHEVAVLRLWVPRMSSMSRHQAVFVNDSSKPIDPTNRLGARVFNTTVG